MTISSDDEIHQIVQRVLNQFAGLSRQEPAPAAREPAKRAGGCHACCHSSRSYPICKTGAQTG